MNRRMARALEQALIRGQLPRRRLNPLLWLYRWRYEWGLVVLLGGLVALGVAVHWSVSALIVAAGIAVVGLSPSVRRLLQTRAHSVVIQHRLRTAFHELGLRTWRGRLPAILWAASKPTGVRVLVSCPAGIEVGDLQELRASLAAACFAAEVTVEQHPRFSNLVTLFVVTSPTEHPPDSGGPITHVGGP
jgi:hypothetical protein